MKPDYDPCSLITPRTKRSKDNSVYSSVHQPCNVYMILENDEINKKEIQALQKINLRNVNEEANK